MPRRRCCGWVDQEPQCRRFTPESRTDAQPVAVGVEELEAVDLKDLEELDQAACAAVMNVSRPTFQRILQAAREKIAMALVQGRTILIEGGSYMVKNRVFECRDCGHTWEVAPCTEGGKHGYELACPQCGSMSKMKVDESGVKHACGGQHHGHGHSHGGGCCGH